MRNNKQLSIPGLENCLPVEKPLENNGGPNIHQQIEDLQDRVLRLELEITLLRIQLERG